MRSRLLAGHDPVDRLLRSVASALVFGTALLYTMEMWWTGITAPAWKVALLLGVAAAGMLLLGLFAGYVRERGVHAVLLDAGEALVVGIALAAAGLWLLGRVTAGTPWRAGAGQVLAMSVPFAVGAFLADLVVPFLSGRLSSRGGDPQPGGATARDVGATIAGGLFLGLPIAPTDEVPMLATGIGPARLMGIVAATLLAAYVVVFASQRGSDGKAKKDGLAVLQRPWTETVFCYAVSLLLALGLLLLFDQLVWANFGLHAVAQTVVLGLPLAIGGAAGRLAV